MSVTFNRNTTPGGDEREVGNDGNVYDSMQDRNIDPHPYSIAYTNSTGTSDSANPISPSLKVILPGKSIVLLTLGCLLCCTVMSILSGVIVYYAINEKMGNNDKLPVQSTQGPEKEALDNVLTELGQLKTNISELAAENARLHQLVHGLEESKSQQTTSQNVVFTAHSPTGELRNKVPTFRYVILNMGGASDNSTGRFTCSVPGLYLFTVTVQSAWGRTTRLYCDIFENGQIITAAHTYEGRHDASAVTLFLMLKKGDLIELRCTNWQDVDQGRFTLYSAALIKPD